MTEPVTTVGRVAVHVAPAAERALRRGHPWVYDGAIRRVQPAGSAGDLAVVFDGRRKFLAVGLYDPDSPIRVRVLQHRKQATIDDDWLAAKIAAVCQRRQPLIDDPATTGYRLVHGENDGLPGLVVDRFADALVIKLDTAAWLPHLASVAAPLRDITDCHAIVLRLNRSIAADRLPAGLADGAVVQGALATNTLQFLENGLTFEADPIDGQKTGFFLDQRDNRQRLGELTDGADVLDVFACTGAFSVYAARGGAKSVTSVDLSKPALAAAIRNMQANATEPGVAAADHHTVAGDAFKVMTEMVEARRRFGVVVLDPPPFARNQSERDGALRAYRRLAGLGLSLVARSGTLVMASCSSRVQADEFYATISDAAHDGSHRLQDIARTGHAIDHPVGFDEGRYLKCLFATVSW